jgi:hypothetical protein
LLIHFLKPKLASTFVSEKYQQLLFSIMKKIFLTAAFAAACVFGAYAQDAKPAPAPAAAQPGNMAAFKWAETTFDFGKIPQGKPVTHEFKFTNTGKVPLVLSSVNASCGCTTPEWTKEPIAPGKSGSVKATFNAAGAGAFSKTVTVNANVEGGAIYLTIKGEVLQPETK